MKTLGKLKLNGGCQCKCACAGVSGYENTGGGSNGAGAAY